VKNLNNYFIRRLILIIPILIGVSLISFFIIHLIPGDPARVIAGQGATSEDIALIREEFGLDKPLTEHYFAFVGGIFSGKMKSISSQQPVIDEITPRFWNTVQLATFGIIVATVFGILLGIIAATHKNTFVDNLSMGFSLIGVSMPIFWLGLLLIMLFSVALNWLPAGGKDSFISFILPGITLGLPSAAIIARMTRASMLEIVNQDFIRTAISNGIPQKTIIYKYTLKNAMIPVVTVVGLQFGYMLGGAVLTESVFGWPGLGRLVVQSIFTRDYPIVQSGILLIAMSFVFVNLAVDLLYAAIDPRLRRKK
jgi:ABC-type dipeptide/oligopeptide/nickel transport system permease component